MLHILYLTSLAVINCIIPVTCGSIKYFKKIAVRESSNVRHHCYMIIIIFFRQDVKYFLSQSLHTGNIGLQLQAAYRNIGPLHVHAGHKLHFGLNFFLK